MHKLYVFLVRQRTNGGQRKTERLVSWFSPTASRTSGLKSARRREKKLQFLNFDRFWANFSRKFGFLAWKNDFSKKKSTFSPFFEPKNPEKSQFPSRKYGFQCKTRFFKAFAILHFSCLLSESAQSHRDHGPSSIHWTKGQLTSISHSLCAAASCPLSENRRSPEQQLCSFRFSAESSESRGVVWNWLDSTILEFFWFLKSFHSNFWIFGWKLPKFLEFLRNFLISKWIFSAVFSQISRFSLHFAMKMLSETRECPIFVVSESSLSFAHFLAHRSFSPGVFHVIHVVRFAPPSLYGGSASKWAIFRAENWAFPDFFLIKSRGNFELFWVKTWKKGRFFENLHKFSKIFLHFFEQKNSKNSNI